MKSYSDFTSEMLEKFMKIQDDFNEEYQIDNYANWFYHQATELLTFSNHNGGGEDINFKYIPIGTYSLESNTWMWAWENSDSIEASKFETLRLKEFGIRQNYEKLKNGYFDSDEYDGWAFIAIAHQFLGGIGGYRVPTEHLLAYFLVKELVDNDFAETAKNNTIYCHCHGKQRPAFVCQHLNKTTKTGFEEAFESDREMELDDDDNFQAWCNECEIVRQSTNGWNDESIAFANIKIICEDCYFEIKEFNLNS